MQNYGQRKKKSQKYKNAKRKIINKSILNSLLLLIERVINVASGFISVKGTAIVLVQRPTVAQSFNQVRIRNKETAETAQVTRLFCNIESSLGIVSVATSRNEGTLPDLTERIKSIRLLFIV